MLEQLLAVELVRGQHTHAHEGATMNLHLVLNRKRREVRAKVVRQGLQEVGFRGQQPLERERQAVTQQAGARL